MAKLLKKIGSNIDLKGIIIHQVIKDPGTRLAVTKAAEQVIRVQDREKLFIGSINKSYFKRSSPVYGIFANENPTFKDILKRYTQDNHFYNFSIDTLAHYKTILEPTVAATGGFLILAHFINTDNHNEYMLVLTINNKDGYVVSEADLTLKDVKNLDLSKVDVACMINLTKWKNIESEVDKESQTYLSFVKGNKDVSYYFMSFIDCDNKTTSSESTKRLTTAFEAYSKEKGYDRETKIRKRNEVFVYCEDCINSNKEIQLSVISAIIDVENPEDFQEFAADENYGVSSIISGDKSKLKPMKFVMYKDKKMTVEFDCNLLDRVVFYSAAKNELRIKNLPQELIDQIPK